MQCTGRAPSFSVYQATSSRDLRDQALRQLDAGRPVVEVAAIFGGYRSALARGRRLSMARVRGECGAFSDSL